MKGIIIAPVMVVSFDIPGKNVISQFRRIIPPGMLSKGLSR